MTADLRPSVLVVAHRVPYPPDKGDRIRTYHLLRFLAGRAEVDLACLADEPPHPDAERRLASLCRRVAVVPVGPNRWPRAAASLALGGTASEGLFRNGTLESILARWSARRHYDAALASASSVAGYLRSPGLRDVPAVVDLVDVDSQKWFDYAEGSSGPKVWLYRTEGRRLRALEIAIAGWARAVTLVSEAELRLYREFSKSGRAEAVTNGVDLEYFRPGEGPAEERDCLFVGAMDYRPNVDAATWFAGRVWPSVMRKTPRARFRVVGRNPAPAVRSLAGRRGVEVVGSVPDVRPYLERAGVVVAPLRIARGLQNKVLEAMACGKAVLTTPKVKEGLGRADAPVVTAEGGADWVDQLTRLLGDPEECRRLGAEARAYVEAYHDWETCLSPFAELIAGDSPPAGRDEADMFSALKAMMRL